MKTNNSTLSVVTYNIGGGARDLNLESAALRAVIRKENPDLLGLQEVIRRIDNNGHEHNPLDEIITVLGGDHHALFAPTLSLAADYHPGKDAMVEARAEGDQLWEQGNALLSRQDFIGNPLNLPLFQPPKYLGNRDTDPRFALASHVRLAAGHFLFITLHLTTLRFERGPEELPGRDELARTMRLDQVKVLLSTLEDQRDETIVLTGDFNAMPGEYCMHALEAFGFRLLAPENEGVGTHPKAARPIDHILLYPGEKVASFSCRIIATDEARAASDHFPLITEIHLN